MFITRWQTDQGLWQSALTLVRGQHHRDAFEVMKAIAVQTVQSVGGNISFGAFPAPQKQLDEKEILYMQSLSNEIAQSVKKREKDKAAELTAEYLERFVHLLSETDREADDLHKELLKGFIEYRLTEPPGKRYIKISTFKTPAELRVAPVKLERVDCITSREAAEIGGVSDQTIRRWCERGKFPEAFKTDGGHWRIPKKYFKMSLQEARKADAKMKQADEDTRRELGGNLDEFDLDLDYS
ncbi:helix-turn-helix domain-containing protein [Metabacillus indicus]|uniref:helix-turn-helix domain-containing protein n=1 Tax=Metabacillus indicus TaxID=246786 RepID=UPI00317293E7